MLQPQPENPGPLKENLRVSRNRRPLKLPVCLLMAGKFPVPQLVMFQHKAPRGGVL